MDFQSKKLINDPNDVVTEFIEGLVETYPGLQYLDGFPDVKVVLRADVSGDTYDKVAVISGGGSGHEPAHAGFVGEGMLTAAICGDVFASPPVDSILSGLRAVTGPLGCLLIVKNYTGDRLHFGLAAEQAKSEGYKVEDLESSLKKSRAKWKIVVGHHAIRSVGHHGDTPELVNHLLPILQAYSVDFYMNGHDDCLEHISDNQSPIQFSTSGAGSKAWRGDLKNLNEEALKFFYDGQGFMSVQLTKSDAEMVFYDVFGRILHRWTRSKQLHSYI